MAMRHPDALSACALPICFATMSNCKDAQGAIRLFDEAHPIVADAQPQIRFYTLQSPNIACAGFGELLECGEDAHGGGSIQPAERRNVPLRTRVCVARSGYRSFSSSGFTLNSERTSSCAMPAGFCVNQRFDRSTASRSASLWGSSSAGAFAIARETGSVMASSMPTTAESCRGPSRSMRLWACSFLSVFCAMQARLYCRPRESAPADALY